MVSNRQRHDGGGFTIVELLLATTVFAVVLLVALNSFLQIGRLFYKGVSVTQTQNTATQALNDIASSIQGADNISTAAGGGGIDVHGGDYFYYCIGAVRYTYTTYNSGGQQTPTAANISVDPPNYSPNGSFGLLKDVPKGGCVEPCTSCGAAGLDVTKPTEMLGDNMRITDLKIVPASSGSKLYNVNMVIAYGASDVLDLSDLTNPKCLGGSAEQQFCFIAHLSTSVFKGLHT